MSKRGTAWTAEESRVLLELAAKRWADHRIADYLYEHGISTFRRTQYSVHNQRGRLIGYDARRPSGVEVNPRAGIRKCLCCRGQFRSPDRRQIQICDRCKDTDIYRGAA